MTGIYRITNTLTSQSYIGQSADIERRFAEHKTPKANGNPRLHNDMKKYGLENFLFEVIEECSKSELKSREQFYIKKELPHYNTIGKPCPEERKEKLSNSIKQWWQELPEQKKNKIYNNLKPPKVGHPVSKETREKLRQSAIKQLSQKVMIVETKQTFNSIKECEKYLGAYKGTCSAYFAGKIKSVKGYHIVKCRD